MRKSKSQVFRSVRRLALRLANGNSRDTQVKSSRMFFSSQILFFLAEFIADKFNGLSFRFLDVVNMLFLNSLNSLKNVSCLNEYFYPRARREQKFI